MLPFDDAIVWNHYDRNKRKTQAIANFVEESGIECSGISNTRNIRRRYYNSLWWSWECVLDLIIIIKPEVRIVNHCLWLGYETMVCAVCLTMFLQLCHITVKVTEGTKASIAYCTSKCLFHSLFMLTTSNFMKGPRTGRNRWFPSQRATHAIIILPHCDRYTSKFPTSITDYAWKPFCKTMPLYT